MFVVVQIEPLIEGEPPDAPTIVEVWGGVKGEGFDSEQEAIDWSDAMAKFLRLHEVTQMRFHVQQVREQIPPEAVRVPWFSR